MRPTVVRFQTQDGTWEVGGVDRKAGIMPENVKYASDDYGPSRASFDLRRDPGAIWPDLKAFTPVDLEVDGALVWSGRIKETPTTESADNSVVNVQAEGWQYHLDDDVFQKTYVHTRLPDWRDLRSFPTTTISRIGMAAGQVTTDRGAITFGWPKGAQVAGGTDPWVGVTLDLGPTSAAKRIVIDWAVIGNAKVNGISNLIIRGHDTENGVAGPGFEDALNADLNGLSSTGTTAYTFTTPRRYVSVGVHFINAGNVTFGEDNLLRITAAKVFSDTAYESGNASIFKASAGWLDALIYAPLLSTDRSGIAATSFNIPEYALADQRTPRESIDALNAYHNYQFLVDVRRRAVARPRPNAPVIKIGAASGAQIEDASANSGDEIYNRAVVTGTGPDGGPIVVERRAAQQPGIPLLPLSSPSLSNPSFAVDTSNWTNVAARDTAVFDTSPASGKVSPSFEAQQPFTGTFQAGRTYVLTFGIRADTAKGNGVTVRFGDYFIGRQDYSITTLGSLSAGAFVSVSIVWTPSSNITTGYVGLQNQTTADMWIDSFALFAAAPTIPDLRGFRRTKHLPVGFSVTSTSAQQLADIFLQGHMKTPFKGSVEVQGSEAVSKVIGGEPVGPHLLPLYAGELLRLEHRIDPDTGGLGRDGRIAEVEVDLASDSATIALDSTRKNFEAFLERLAVVTDAAVPS